MPKIDVDRPTLMAAIGTDLSDDALEAILPAAKAELDEPANADGIMKIELNDTNRPDLWSTRGLARQLRLIRGGARPEYAWISTAQRSLDPGERRLVVDPSVASVRPYIVGFVAESDGISDAQLRDIIQTQEKLTWNYGRKRRSIAMGVYRADLMAWPAHYRAADPDATSFVPLGETSPMTMREIVTNHPKGREFGHIHADAPRWPLLTDDRGDVLSFPPVINSATLGAVEVGDRSLFIELTGTDLDSLLHSALIVACDLADGGHAIHPVAVTYPEATAYGAEIVVPFAFQPPASASLEEIRHMLSGDLSDADIEGALTRMGLAPQIAAGRVTVAVPPYRNDFLHPVDVVEDVMIGHGLDAFTPRLPNEFTVGRLSPVERYGRTLKELFVGLGYQEMIFNYLGSAHDFIERMYPPEEWEAQRGHTVEIANPMSENYAMVRPSVLASLMAAEAASAHAALPHRIFAVGKIARRGGENPSGTETLTGAALVHADRDVGFNGINSEIATVLYYLGLDAERRDTSDSRFIPGRVAELVVAGRAVGRFGELHPRLLDAWGVQVPAVAAEFTVEALMTVGERGDA